MNIKTLLMLVAILNMGVLYSSDDLLIARGGERGGGAEFRGGGEERGRGDENHGARDAAAMGAAHRSGEQEGYNAGAATEEYYAPPPEYYPDDGSNQNQPSQ